MIEIIRELMSVPFFRRLFVVSLLPNVLVWGFSEVGINNNRNYFWKNFLEPYIFVEKVIIGVVLAILLFHIAKSVLNESRREPYYETDEIPLVPVHKERTYEHVLHPSTPVYSQALKENSIPAQAPKPTPPTAAEVKARALNQITGGGN